MNLWRELRTRWMYWRYRYITRNRQRFAARRLARRGPRPLYQPTYGRGQPAVAGRYGRTATTWVLLLITVLVMAIVQHFTHGQDLVFILDIGILVAAYFTWTRVTV